MCSHQSAVELIEKGQKEVGLDLLFNADYEQHYNLIESYIDEFEVAIEEWTNNTGDDQIKCPNCESVDSIVHYIFEPTWAFGGLGLTFWNWGTFKETFFEDLENLMGKKLRVVYGKM